MTGGYYTNQNAAAFVARCGDSIILSFRGTNDNSQPNADSGVINPNDTANNIRPDVDQWGQANDGSNQSMTNHYALFNNLITAFDAYVSTASNGINHVYVTGHSLGGAMALEYMSLHAGNQYQAVTFAAPAFTNADISRQNFSADSRVIQIEVAKDPVPMTWDIKNLLGNTSNRQGEVIRFSGDNTLATPDDHTAIFGTVGFKANDNNHSMDYYRTITDNVDAVTWQSLLGLTGTQEVFLGGNRTVTNRIENFTVATNNDILAPTDKNYNAIYGGLGADIITGGAANELIIGGQGKDSLTGGLGTDTFSFYSAIESGLTDTTRDLIQDFTHAESDRINLASIDANTMMDGNNVFAFINSNAFSAPGQIRFANGILAANTDADLQAEFQIALTGVTSLTATDIIL
jgi:Ca2+-binding RTX toxin-like protein